MRIVSRHAIRPGLVAMIDPMILLREGGRRVGPSDCTRPHPFLCCWNAGDGVWAWTALTSSDEVAGWGAMRNRVAIPVEHRIGMASQFRLSPCYVFDTGTYWLARGSAWVEASITDRFRDEMGITPAMLDQILAKMRRAA